jgi:N-acyl homoserine lactone hydrolase
VREVSVGTDPRPIALPLPGGSEGATVRVHLIKTGEMMSPPAFIDRPPGRLAWPRMLATRRSKWVALPIPAFLVEHPTVGPILIDTGLHPSVAEDPKQNFGRVSAAINTFRMERSETLREQVAARGVEPNDVSVVVMTHLHYDHASAVSEWPEATFVVDQREWDAASGGGARQGYHPRQFDHAFDWQAIDYDAESVDSFATFAHSVDLFGDGSVRLLATPGHTLGHQSVLLALGGGREALVCGDAAYTLKTIREGAAPLITADEHRFWRSLREIERYSEHTPGAILIPGHDPENWPELDAVYE